MLLYSRRIVWDSFEFYSNFLCIYSFLHCIWSIIWAPLWKSAIEDFPILPFCLKLWLNRSNLYGFGVIIYGLSWVMCWHYDFVCVFFRSFLLNPTADWEWFVFFNFLSFLYHHGHVLIAAWIYGCRYSDTVVCRLFLLFLPYSPVFGRACRTIYKFP